MTVERWQFPSGRVATIDLRQSPEAVEDARRLLQEFGDAELINENAPAAGGHQREGEDQKPTEEPIMNESKTTVKYNASDVAAALAAVDATEDGQMAYLEPEDALYREIPAVRVVKASEMDPEFTLEGATFETQFALITPEGVPLLDLPEGWWQEATADIPRHTIEFWQSHPNHMLRMGENLAISRGQHIAVAEVVEDGEPAFELVTLDELHRCRRAEKAVWAAAHPEAMIQLPWASAPTVEDLEGIEGVDIWWEREFGPVRLSKHATWTNGEHRFDDDTTAPAVTVDRDLIEDMTVEDMRELVAALMAAIPVLEAALAEEVTA